MVDVSLPGSFLALVDELIIVVFFTLDTCVEHAVVAFYKLNRWDLEIIASLPRFH